MTCIKIFRETSSWGYIVDFKENSLWCKLSLSHVTSSWNSHRWLKSLPASSEPEQSENSTSVALRLPPERQACCQQPAREQIRIGWISMSIPPVIALHQTRRPQETAASNPIRLRKLQLVATVTSPSSVLQPDKCKQGVIYWNTYFGGACN